MKNTCNSEPYRTSHSSQQAISQLIKYSRYLRFTLRGRLTNGPIALWTEF